MIRQVGRYLGGLVGKWVHGFHLAEQVGKQVGRQVGRLVGRYIGTHACMYVTKNITNQEDLFQLNNPKNPDTYIMKIIFNIQIAITLS